MKNYDTGIGAEQVRESKQLAIGRAGEYLVMFDLLSRGKKCFLTDQGVNYDVVLDLGEKLVRLQVKTTQRPMKMNRSYASLVYLFHPRRAGRGGAREYRVGEFDGFALVAMDTRTVHYYLFDRALRKTLIFRDRRQTYKQQGPHVCPFIDEFTLDRFLAELAATQVGNDLASQRAGQINLFGEAK